MRTLGEIQTAIEELSPAQLAGLSQWFDEYRETLWDNQIISDAESGKFNHFKRAISQARLRGELIDFP